MSLDVSMSLWGSLRVSEGPGLSGGVLAPFSIICAHVALLML